MTDKINFHVIVPTLNIRSGPSTSTKIVGKLHYGDVIEAIGLSGTNVWVETEKGFVALRVGGSEFLAWGLPKPRPTNPVDFDPPVGTSEERESGKVWPGQWVDANGYCNPYSMGYHTGADLNLNPPGNWNADKGAPVHSISDGQVTFAGKLPGSWGNVVVIRHYDMSDGSPVYSRYAHLSVVLVQAGDHVNRGTIIGFIGGMPGVPDSEHLHFDISLTHVLADNPGHWSGFGPEGKAGVLEHYVDPLKFLLENKHGVGFPEEPPCEGGTLADTEGT